MDALELSIPTLFSISIGLFTIGFGLYIGITQQLLHKAKFGDGRHFTRRGKQIRDIVGALSIGIIPIGIIAWLADINRLTPALSFHLSTRSLVIILVLLPIVIFMNQRIARQPEHQDQYPLMMKSAFTPNARWSSIMGWFLYLLGYEWMFRGLLFFLGIEVGGILFSVCLNLALYVLAHLDQGWREMLGSFLIGGLFCFLAWDSQSFLPAWILHTIFAVSNEWFTVKYSPDIRFE